MVLANNEFPVITLEDNYGAVAQLISETCSAGTISGECSVTFTSPTTGMVTVKADVVMNLLGLLVSRADQADKLFVDGSLTITPEEYTRFVGDPHTFTVSTTDVYTFEVTSAWGDAGLALFQGAFDPTNPCQNMIGNSQDQILGDGFLAGIFGPAAGNPLDPIYRLALPLRAGETYTLLTTSWDDLTTGTYTWDALNE